MKNLSLYDNNLSVPRKQDVDKLKTRLDTAEDQLIVLDSDITSLEGDMAKKLTTPTGNQGQYLGFTANNVVGAVDAPSDGGGAYSKTFSGTLSTTWEGASAPFYQQFTVADMTDKDCPLVFPQWSSIPVNDAQKTAWNTIENAVESLNGFVKFYSKTKTTTAVNFIMYY